MEQELQTMLGLAMPEDPEPKVSAQSPPQVSSKEPENPAQPVEPASSLCSFPDPAPLILNPPKPDARSSNDMWVDQMNITPVTTLPPDRTPAKEGPPLSNPTPSTIKPQPSWNPIGFVNEENEEEEEIPSIDMDLDSD